MTCPWDSFRASASVFCEAPLCAWIREPANTWSNLAFLVVAALLFARPGRHAKALAAVSLITGFGSAIFHATGTFLGGIADYAGMYLGTGVMTALNVRRWRHLGWPWIWGVLALTSSVLLAGAIWFPELERTLYMLAMPCCLIEVRLWIRDRGTRYYWYLVGTAAAIVGVVYWSLDVSGVLCDPDNHWLNGHALWHVWTAFALYAVARYYEQFSELA